MNGLLARFWPIIALAFPVLEIIGIISIWDRIGAWTLLWLLLAVLAGSALISLERIAFMPSLAAAMATGGNPFEAIKASGLRFLAGVLLIFPGAISDVMALILLLWAGFQPPAPPPARRGPDRAANDDVIEGDFRRVDD
ncbi:MAG: FxsA family protein [Gallionellaceae bacterium]|nr:FxsA family protein [Gallionellaceae bacterium]